MFQPLEDCICKFVTSCALAGYSDVTINNFRIERENNKMFVYFEADLKEDNK